jgi:hypothetical protein
MRHALVTRQQYTPQVALSDSDKLKPVEPAYMKPLEVSGIASSNRVPSLSVKWKAPVVSRVQDTVGMRYIYSRGGIRQPLQKLGNGPNLGIAVWTGMFQQIQVQRHNWGFYDKLFQAGYPGYNLGLSFKVFKLTENGTGGPGYNMKMGVVPRFTKVQKVSRSVNAPGYYNTTSANG